MANNKVIVVAGPTATGKTKTALEIARKVNGELINADSRQVYRFMNIGTNKEDIQQISYDTYTLSNIPVHLVNILNPDEQFDLYKFNELAKSKISDLLIQGKTPIIVGGTGLYIDSLLKGYKLSNSQKNQELRDELEKLKLEDLQQKLEKTNINTYLALNESDKHNKRRLIRLIEKNIHNVENSQEEPKYNFLILYPTYDWEALKVKINERVDTMFSSGLIEEVKDIISKGYKKDCFGLQVMGYKEVVNYLDNKISLEEAKILVKTAHRQYAKRQKTWFESGGRGYKLTKYKNSKEAAELAFEYIKK